jgi:polysaccharide biosynthesis/export protein
MARGNSLRAGCVALAFIAAALAGAGVFSAPGKGPPREQNQIANAGLSGIDQAGAIQLCQAVAPVPCQTGDCAPPCGPACGAACERPISGVDCLMGNGCGEPRWNDWGPIPWQAFSQGEYIGPARMQHVPEYRLRVDDQIEFTYVLTREELGRPYTLEVGDAIRIESLIDPTLNRDVTIQPDGTVDLLLLGPIRVVGLDVAAIVKELNERYKKYYKVTDLSVTRLKTQTRLDDLRSAVDNRFFSGGQGKLVRVTPEGTISLPSIGVVPAQGLTLEELKLEVDQRYREIVGGLEVTPILAERAARFIYVVGEVRAPGRYELIGPTTTMQSISLAGGWNIGGNLRQIVVFRRADDWRLLATKIDIRGGLYGERPIPSDEIWLRDSDIVLVPKSPALVTTDMIDLLFTRGVYKVLPMNFTYQFGGVGGTSVITP